MTECSSTVMTRSVRSAAATIASTSSGLRVGTWTHVGVDAVGGQDVGRVDDRGASAIPVQSSVTSRPSRTDDGLAELEPVVVVEEALGGVADEPDVARALVARRPSAAPGAASTSSAGATVTMPGIARMIDRSSTMMWLIPVWPVNSPA